MSGGKRRDAAVRRTIVVDGVEFAGVEEMPPEVRRVYEETIGSLQGGGGQAAGSSHVVRTEDGLVIRSDDTRITVGGETVDLANVPPRLREVVERHLARASAPAAAGSDRPREEVRSHTVRIVHETRSGGHVSTRRRGRYPAWVTLLILAACAAILAWIFLAS